MHGSVVLRFIIRLIPIIMRLSPLSNVSFVFFEFHGNHQPIINLTYKSYRNLNGVFLDGLLQVNIVLVADIQRHFQLGDLHLQLLLDAGNLGLKFGLSFNKTRAHLFDFDGHLFAEKSNK